MRGPVSERLTPATFPPREPFAMPAICGQCREPIPDEEANAEFTERKPCPKCGSTTRAIHADLNVVMQSMALVAHAEVTTYPARLLQVARKLIDDAEFSIAIVVCHMACEVAVERTFNEAFPAKGLSYLENSVMAFVNGNNLATDRIRDLYTALTGNEVVKQPFWPDFKASARRRNDIMHGQRLATRQEAEDSHASCNSLVGYLGK